MNRRSIEEIPDEWCAAYRLLQPRCSGEIAHTRRWWTSGAADGARTSAVYGDLDASRISLLEGARRRGGTADLGMVLGLADAGVGVGTASSRWEKCAVDGEDDEETWCEASTTQRGRGGQIIVGRRRIIVLVARREVLCWESKQKRSTGWIKIISLIVAFYCEKGPPARSAYPAKSGEEEREGDVPVDIRRFTQSGLCVAQLLKFSSVEVVTKGYVRASRSARWKRARRPKRHEAQYGAGERNAEGGSRKAGSQRAELSGADGVDDARANKRVAVNDSTSVVGTCRYGTEKRGAGIPRQQGTRSRIAVGWAGPETLKGRGGWGRKCLTIALVHGKTRTGEGGASQEAAQKGLAKRRGRSKRVLATWMTKEENKAPDETIPTWLKVWQKYKREWPGAQLHTQACLQNRFEPVKNPQRTFKAPGMFLGGRGDCGNIRRWGRGFWAGNMGRQARMIWPIQFRQRAVGFAVTGSARRH
ncbi:hypothetical protein B0H13DRAFT_2576864 [Mycena leptocephala]|nr:hypothetical protein B0H13DRAFT_2576864 [Mycena leptocephala]